MNTPLPRLPMLYLLATFTLVLAPHCWQFGPWHAMALAGVLFWRIWIAYRGQPLPAATVRLLLSLGLFLLVWLEYHTLIGRQAGVATLASLATIKLFETRSRRDIYVISLLAYFLIGAGFLISQSQWILLWSVLSMLAVTGQLIQWQSPQPWLPLGKQLLLILAEALPLALLLFFFFPRLAPLWSMPDKPGGARTGIGNEMRPGEISKLANDESVAFRVEFAGEVPKPATRYWRGPVFDYFDGEAWLPPRPDPSGGPRIEATGPALHYTITMEPHQRNWLMALDLPSVLPESALLSNRLQAVSSSPITQRQRYRIESHLAWRTGGDKTINASLQLPAGGNPQSRALAAGWRSFPPQERIHQAMKFLQTGGFSYTLQPGLHTGKDGIDHFLFTSKQGFCEHYASAFTFLMRSAGVPTRVVAGYQGGEWNKNGQYLIVRQSDAHAWTEVWLANSGWQRVDPTAVIAPARINSGSNNELPFMPEAGPRWLHDFHLNWDSAINNWNQWVIGYDTRQQMQLFKKLGIPDLLSGAFILWLAMGMGMVLLLLFLFSVRSLQRKQDPASLAWRSFCKKLAKKGCQPSLIEGPLTFSQRASLHCPEYSDTIQEITQLYIAARYGDDTTALPELKQAVRHFHM